MQKHPYYADSLGFPGVQAQPQVPHPDLAQFLDLVMVTMANPWSSTTDEALEGIQRTAEEMFGGPAKMELVRSFADIERIDALDDTVATVFCLQRAPFDAHFDNPVAAS